MDLHHLNVFKLSRELLLRDVLMIYFSISKSHKFGQNDKLHSTSSTTPPLIGQWVSFVDGASHHLSLVWLGKMSGEKVYNCRPFQNFIYFATEQKLAHPASSYDLPRLYIRYENGRPD